MQVVRHRYPFRLGTTSFILPAGYVTNVQSLAPFVDEIELLLFESAPDAWPTRDEIHRLSHLARELDLTYNVHLPLDIELGAVQRKSRDDAVAGLTHLLERVAPLCAVTNTLHLACPSRRLTPEELGTWQECTFESLTALLSCTHLPARRFSIETLDYPPRWFAPQVNTLDLSVCLDIGHVVRYGFDLAQTVADFHDRITILHLHGVEAEKDHRSLTHLPLPARGVILPFLRDFSGSVSLEVFAMDLLQDSLSALKGMMADIDRAPDAD